MAKTNTIVLMHGSNRQGRDVHRTSELLSTQPRFVFNTESNDVEVGHRLKSDNLAPRGLNDMTVVGVIKDSNYKYINVRTGELSETKTNIYQDEIEELNIGEESDVPSASIIS